MTAKLRLTAQLALPCLWLAACYGLRFHLMEDAAWLEMCGATPQRFECRLRDMTGLAIHYGVLAWISVALAVPAFFVRGKHGRRLAWLALAAAIAALVLYTVTMAAFALLLGALRLIRDERHSASASNNVAPAQPSA
jgi:hypothetical protein